ncbi:MULTISPECIES: tRNA-binding protein [Mesonia]|uniref:Chaperone CsaA n=1 Tax=Mesonia oceanica TaxID=2687242 RepID=A0AC61YA91_9FLAO|nr:MULTISPECIES: tRNA-binding protein [Mesonia]MAN26683.1 tRNA-binding protein [Mesonia sp.]MAQ39802.1 tRNA-binding protein [Mesonia sp.]MBJ96659.1 tRNA-binding protein [Flavobacteriaceae bacterium]VVV01356.1 putative chaperone CsaA [Mesonia oceanica]|tara:strand:- start:3495 stop:3836 length:342 start_codon:yes stop_codon:yes gene_type:complete
MEDNKLTWQDFAKVDMRVGTIIEVSDFPEARKPAYQLKIEFGEEIGVRKTSAQITKRYTKEELLGKQTIAVVNFPKKQIANFMSECLLLGAVNSDEVTIIQPGANVPNGLRIS